MKAIIEAVPIPIELIQQQIDVVLREAGRKALADYHSATRTWTHKPRFRMWGPRWGSGRRSREVVIAPEPGDSNTRIMEWVEFGTRPHDISARNRPRLAFQIHYRRKTRPFGIQSTSGGKSGPWRRPISVRHPGIRHPRRFSYAIAERHAGWFHDRMQRVVADFARQANQRRGG